MNARIVRILSKDYTLLLEDGTRVTAVAMGKLRKNESPVVGDLVEAEVLHGTWGIQKIYPRRNCLIRPACANVDQALIVMSVKDPDFSPALIDRLSVLITHAGITPLLCITKCDLGISEETAERIAEYERGPMKVLRTAKDSLNPEVAEVFRDRITVLTGQSGAGKSTLLNEINPEFRLETQEISKALGRGKHTTRHSELHEVAGGLVADTPGFSSLDFSHMQAEDLDDAVPDFAPYIGMCRFNDCVHENEPDCAIKQAVQDGRISRTRYGSYLDMLKLIRSRKESW
ncbi:MAG: ribosome small subunit-dependent GTPase A [Solobacterium sp.]|jgi:ribosome biogenesis GTPase|nr:ribosome small subunit-dependent GTPase A [Solobacterium sp.]